MISPPSVREAPVERLARLSLFASLTRPELAAIAPLFEPQAYERDAVVFHEGEAPRWLYVVVDGHVKLLKHSEAGREVILHLALPGDLIGGVSAFGRRPHPFTARTMSRSTALRVAGPDYAAIMDAHPAVARRTLDDLIERLTEAHETMKSLAVERVERRVARQLVKLARRLGVESPAGLCIGIALTRQDVADMAGTSVETAIRVLSRWRQQGLVTDSGGYLVLPDPAALAAVAEEDA
jgi:CRP/FNR family transcriptional regulator